MEKAKASFLHDYAILKREEEAKLRAAGPHKRDPNDIDPNTGRPREREEHEEGLEPQYNPDEDWEAVLREYPELNTEEFKNDMADK
jgi:hypothetical protein